MATRMIPCNMPYSTRAGKRPRAPHYQPFDASNSSSSSAVVYILSMVPATGYRHARRRSEGHYEGGQRQGERCESARGFDHPYAARPFLTLHVSFVANLFFLLVYQTFTHGLSPGQGLLPAASSKRLQRDSVRTRLYSCACCSSESAHEALSRTDPRRRAPPLRWQDGFGRTGRLRDAHERVDRASHG